MLWSSIPTPANRFAIRLEVEGSAPSRLFFTIPDEADGVVFITGVSGGMLVATSPDLDDATVDLFEQ